MACPVCLSLPRTRVGMASNLTMCRCRRLRVTALIEGRWYDTCFELRPFSQSYVVVEGDGRFSGRIDGRPGIWRRADMVDEILDRAAAASVLDT